MAATEFNPLFTLATFTTVVIGHSKLNGPYKTRISTHRHIDAFFHADQILDFNL